MPQLKPIRGIRLNKSHPLARGLVGYWLFNEGVGKRLNDSSGRVNAGMFVNGTFWEPARTGFGVGADGSDDSVSFSWSKLGITGYPFSVVWAGKHHTLDSYSNVMVFSASGVVQNSFFVGINSSNKVYCVAYGPTSGFVSVATVQTVVAGERVSGAAVLISSTDRRVYINGGGEAISTVSDDVVFGDMDRFNLFHLERPSSSWYLAKEYEYLFIYNRILIISEIALLSRKPFVMFEQALNVARISSVVANGFVEIAGDLAALSFLTDSADLRRARVIAGGVTAQSSLSGSIKVSRKISGTIAATSSLSGSLSLVGEVSRSRGSGFKPIEGAERLRGLRRSAFY